MFILLSLMKRKVNPGKPSKRPSKRSRPTLNQVAQAVVKRYPGLVRSGGNYARYGGNANRLGLVPERKFFDTALAFSFDVTGEVPATGQLALIPQGDTESTRDGRLAVLKSIQIRGTLVCVPGVSGANGVAFLYVVLDTQANGAAAAVTDVFTSNVMSTNLINLNNSGRFRILAKKVWTFQATAGVSGAFPSQSKQMEWYKKCEIPMDWSSTTGAITEIRSNNVFLLAGSQNLDDDISFTGNCRIRFQG